MIVSTTTRNIRLLEAFSVLNGLWFVLPVLVPFYRDQMGLKFGDFLIADAAFMGTMLLLDVPTGWISDVWSRKITLMAGSVFVMAGWALMLVAKSLLMAVVYESVMGIGFGLLSGTASAMLYDTLLSQGREDEYMRLEGRRRGFGQYATATACVLGALIYPLHHMLPVVLTVVAGLAGLFCLLALREPERHKKRPEKHPFADMATALRYMLNGHADIGAVILFAGALFGTTKLIMWTQQPYYIALGLHASISGMLFAAGWGLAGFMNHAAYRLTKYFTPLQALMLGWGISVAATACAGGILGLHGVALLILGGGCIQGFADPHVSNFVNQNTGSERRATMLSTVSTLSQFTFIFLSLIIGQLSDHVGIQAGLIGIAAWLCLMRAGLWLMGRKDVRA